MHIKFEVHAETPPHMANWSQEDLADTLQAGIAPLVEEHGALAAWVPDTIDVIDGDLPVDTKAAPSLFHTPANPAAARRTNPVSVCAQCGRTIALACTDLDETIEWRTAEITDATGRGTWCSDPKGGPYQEDPEIPSRAVRSSALATEPTEFQLPVPPKYPEGTPEYDAYRAALTFELDKFATQQPPYDQGAQTQDPNTNRTHAAALVLNAAIDWANARQRVATDGSIKANADAVTASNALHAAVRAYMPLVS